MHYPPRLIFQGTAALGASCADEYGVGIAKEIMKGVAQLHRGILVTKKGVFATSRFARMIDFTDKSAGNIMKFDRHDDGFGPRLVIQILAATFTGKR